MRPWFREPDRHGHRRVVAQVNDRGLQGLTTRGLARQLGMNPGIVNQWFG